MSLIQFAPAGSVTQHFMGNLFRSAMPPVDPTNPDTTVALVGVSTAVWFRPGGNVGDPALSCDPGTPGVFRLDPIRPIMFTSNPAIVSAGAALGRVINDAGALASCTSFTSMGQMNGGQIVITRGTATPTVTF